MRLYHTLKYLRRQQLIGQISKRLRPLWESTERFLARPVPKYPGCRWDFEKALLPPPLNQNSADRLIKGEYTFLNQTEQLGSLPIWVYPKLPMLWKYNLHYFEWLWALEFLQAAALTQDWIKQYGLRQGRAGWDSYPISLRLINWCGYYFKKHRPESEIDEGFINELWRSIYRQAEWLAQHLETHLLGNHLLENAAALAFSGSCFKGAAAKKWLDLGISILKEEIPEQVLTDGMHFERSPMYHLRITYLLFLLYQVAHAELKIIVRAPLERMLQALEMLCHPDREIALFNDSAFGIYHQPDDLLEYGRSLLRLSAPDTVAEQGPFALPEAGYYGYRDENGTYLICDAGPIGPDYLPGHAHGDIFSFELSLKGCRVIVDSGVFDYVPGKMRDYCRSTKAHNTVEIGSKDQCEFWGAFRVARRGKPRGVNWEPLPDGFRLKGWHDGYQRLPCAPSHLRQFCWKQGKGLEVQDRVTQNRKNLSAISRLHLHPYCQIEQREGAKVVVKFPKGHFEVTFYGKGMLAVEESLYCPEFGKKLPNSTLAFSFSAEESEIKFNIKSC